MNPDIDPKKFGELVKQANDPQPVKQETSRPVTLPSYIRAKMSASKFFDEHPVIADILSYYIIPAFQNGIHKTASAALDFFILDRDLRPSGNKNGGVYVYSDSRKDYTSYSSQPRYYTASYIGSDGKIKPITADKYRRPSSASFVRIPKRDLDGNLVPWTIGEVEEMSDIIHTKCEQCIEHSDYVSVNDFYDICGQSGAPTTSLMYGWPSIAKLSVIRDPDDPCYIIASMGMDPTEIK